MQLLGASRHPFRARPACAARSVVLALRAPMRTQGCLRYAPETRAGLGTHGRHGLHEKSPSAFVANVSHVADGCRRWERSMSPRVLHQQHHARGIGLVPTLLQLRLHQGCKGDIGLIEQTIQGFGLVPGVQLSGQRTQGFLRQEAFRLNHSSRATQIVQLDAPKGSLGPALGIQQVLCIHPLFYHLGRCG